MPRSELRDAGGEPPQVGRIADEEHGTGAFRWRRVQHIIDPKIAVGLKRYTLDTVSEVVAICIALDKRGHGLANQGGEHARVRIKPNVIASAQQQTPPVDPNSP